MPRNDERQNCYVLDTNAILAFIQNEAGASAMERLIGRASAGRTRLAVCLVSLGELYYTVFQKRGKGRALAALARTEALPFEMITVRRDLAIKAAELKATRSLGYADSYVAACAQELGATLVTGDPDFSCVDDLVRIKWIR